MTELEQHLLASLTKLDAAYSEGLERLHKALLNLENRVSALEKHYPELTVLCNDLERVLREIGA